jgi:hypothetical protein
MKFKSIFEGLKIAYGQYQKGERGENGKQQGKAFIVRKKITDDLWQNHVEGKGAALGIIPITESNTCKWGCIDIDEYNLSHNDLMYFYLQKNLSLQHLCRAHLKRLQKF